MTPDAIFVWNFKGVDYKMEYFEVDAFDNLEKDKITQEYGIAFLDDKVVVVGVSEKDLWNIPGGTVEEGEKLTDTLKREMIEEANCKVLYFEPIGYQKVTNMENGSWGYQLRYYTEVEKLGEFEKDHDPESEHNAVKFIDPMDLEKYVSWPVIGPVIFNKARKIRKQRNKANV